MVMSNKDMDQFLVLYQVKMAIKEMHETRKPAIKAIEVKFH